MTLEELEVECGSCDRCPLGATKKNTVFGTGDPHADIMFVGEAPGANEDAQGIPFVGAAGQLFNEYLRAVGIEREQVYIANILKCRPPRNRDPLPEETAACMPYLREQIRAVSPNIIVCLGRVAARQLIDENFTAGKDHGKWTARGRFLMMGVYHPSLLLRDPSRREDMLADLMEVKRQSEILKLAP